MSTLQSQFTAGFIGCGIVFAAAWVEAQEVAHPKSNEVAVSSAEADAAGTTTVAPTAGTPSAPEGAAAAKSEPPPTVATKVDSGTIKPNEAKPPNTKVDNAKPDAPNADQAKVPTDGYDVVDKILEARCKVAICFGAKRSIGIEPLVELPVGKSFSVNSGAVADYINNHDLRIDLAAGIRVWAFQDWVSLSVYLSKPLSDRSIRIPGSEFNYPASSLRRPLPGFALGLLFDSIWLGLDRDELRNPDGTAGVWHDPSYPPNALVGSSWTVTLALQPVTAFRTGLGVAVSGAKKSNATQSGGGSQ